VEHARPLVAREEFDLKISHLLQGKAISSAAPGSSAGPELLALDIGDDSSPIVFRAISELQASVSI